MDHVNSVKTAKPFPLKRFVAHVYGISVHTYIALT